MVVVCIGIGMLEDRLKLRYVLVFVVIVIVCICMVVDFMSSFVSELVSWCWMYSTIRWTTLNNSWLDHTRYSLVTRFPQERQRRVSKR